MTRALIRGLTLRHPWAWAFQQAGKDVENRIWHPSRQGGHVGMYLALHGGAMPPARGDYWDEIADACRWMAERGAADRAQLHALLREGRPLCVPGIVAVARLAEVRTDSPSSWAAQGQQHWCLDQIVVLPAPIAHRGAQGLWEVQPDALAQLRAAWAGRSP